MHKASPLEHDLPCNARCAGDVHADLAYTLPWSPVTPDKALCSLQAAADRWAREGRLYPIEIVSVSVVLEAPTVGQRYPTEVVGDDSDATAYLVYYRLREEISHGD